MAEILILGAAGRLGQAFSRQLGRKATAFNKHQWDITQEKKSKKMLRKYKPSVVINCAGYVLVDQAEKEPIAAYKLNAIAPALLARLCHEKGIRLVHFSTDYVFSGEKHSAYHEEDVPSPINQYGLSKWIGECFVRQFPEHLIVRTCGLFGYAESSKKEDFIVRILRKAKRKEKLFVVKDIIVSPTYAEDCAKASWQLIQKGERGLFHVTNRGRCSWYAIARYVLQKTFPSARLEAIKASELRTRRPQCSALQSKRLKELGLYLPSWKNAVRRYLQTGVVRRLYAPDDL